MDEWAHGHDKKTVLAQIGRGEYTPRYMQWKRMLVPSEYRKVVEQSKIIVAHAGMGSFFFAMEMQKPIVMLPRYAARNEHTTDHQVHTLKWLRHKPNVYAAMTEEELPKAIENALANAGNDTSEFHRFAPEQFVQKIRQFLVQ